MEPGEAVLVVQLFDRYLHPQATVYQVAKWLTGLGVATPTGKPRWTAASVRGILRNPAYARRAQTNRTRVIPARQRRSPLLPAGPGESHAPRPEEDWIEVPVPQLVPEETFAQVQAKLDTNQQAAARNTRHEYLLRALVSCGICRLWCPPGRPREATTTTCAAATRRAARGPGPAVHGPLHPGRTAGRAGLGRLVRAADRSRSGRPRAEPGAGRGLAASGAPGQAGGHPPGPWASWNASSNGYWTPTWPRSSGWPNSSASGKNWTAGHAALAAQQRQLDAAAEQRLELQAVADGIETFCQSIRAGLATATFTQRRQLVELLIDRVVVTDNQVEIRYVLPTSPDGPHRPFCQLRGKTISLSQR